MMFFVFFTQTIKNLDGLIHAGLFHHNRLETTFQRGIRFDAFAIFVEGGRTDNLQLAP